MKNLKVVLWLLACGALGVSCSSSDKQGATVAASPQAGQGGGGTGGIMLTGGADGGVTAGSGGTSGYAGSATAGSAGSSAGSGGEGTCTLDYKGFQTCVDFDPTKPDVYVCTSTSAAAMLSTLFNGQCTLPSPSGTGVYALCCPATDAGP